MGFQIVLYLVFGLGAVAAVTGLAFGVVAKIRDKRTAQERWADEHGDQDPNKVSTPAGPQTLWFGTGR